MGNCFSSTTQNAVSQGMGDAQQAVGLIDGVYKMVQPHVLEIMSKRDETTSLKKILGGWWKEAFEHGVCMVPVLDIDNCEKHLRRRNGVLEPRGNCGAISPWGYLLHALAINPGDGVLTWKPAGDLRWDMPEGKLTMEVRGAAFCHLVNLYKVRDRRDIAFMTKDDRDLQLSGRCRLSFGWLEWPSTEAEHISVKFEPDTIPKLNACKDPFGDFGKKLLTEPKHDLWRLYDKALKQGVSDDELLWLDANKTTPSERLLHLITNLGKLMDNSRGPCLLTPGWLDHATRIKRHAMSNGGEDDTFRMNAGKILAQHPITAKQTEGERILSQKKLGECFFFKKDGFSILQQYAPTVSSDSTGFEIPLEAVLNDTLESYSAEKPESWKGQLYAAKAAVLKVALMNRNWDVHPDNVRLLEFTPKDPLWSARVHIGLIGE